MEEHRFIGIDNGYYGEFRNFFDAVVSGEPVVSSIEQNVRNMLVVLRGLDSAEQGRVMTLDDAPGGLAAKRISLWRPHGASGLFDGLPGERTTVTRRWDPQ
jgi:hypothetical protein